MFKVSCINSPADWRDSLKRSCWEYQQRDLCVPSGAPGFGWWNSSSGKGGPDRTFDDFAAGGRNATLACCACGGGEPSWQEAGEQISDRVVGGSHPSRPIESFAVPFWRFNEGFQFGGCGAVLVGRRHAITAAHCKPEGWQSLFLNAYRIYDPDNGGYPFEVINIRRKILHPKWENANEGLTFQAFDLAILELDSEVSDQTLRTRKAVVPNLAYTKGLAQRQALATVMGYGTLSFEGEVPTVVQAVQLPLVTWDRCRSWARQSLSVTSLCAGDFKGGRDSCQGDSGGPLYYLDEAGTANVVGLVSWGARCASAGTYGVYTNLSCCGMMEWLRSYIPDISERGGGGGDDVGEAGEVLKDAASTPSATGLVASVAGLFFLVSSSLSAARAPPP